MFCPSCGSEQAGQYCRACGADLRAIRLAVERPTSLTAATSSAREEIGRAVADKIRELKSAKELSKVVEDVLPEINKFLEAPEEKRLRRIRRGTITSAIGLSMALAFTIFGVAVKDEGFFFFGAMGFMMLLIGLGVLLNGWHFTMVQTPSEKLLPEALQKALHTAAPPSLQDDSFLTSITEHTTHQLPELHARKAKLE